MQYMFLLCATDDHRIITPEERNGRITRQYAVMDDARKRGVLISVGLLAPPATAKTMRSSQGLSMSTDGPFAETKEQLGGYYLLECTNEAEAHYWAARMADTGCATCVEFRPLVEIPARVDEAAQVQAVHA